MFLAYRELLVYKIEYVFNVIENNSVLIGLITSVIVGSLWMRKFIRQKRAEAFFGFYAQLFLQLELLKEKLNDSNQLNITDPNLGNIYLLFYEKDYMKMVCPNYILIASEKLKSCQKICEELKKTLLESENNVFPQKSKSEEWYKNQCVLLSFFEFLTNESGHHKANKQPITGNQEESWHIAKCRELVDAINYIQGAIANSKY